MQTHRLLQNWSELKDWLDQYGDGQTRYAFRGQANSDWLIRTSLARHFMKHPIPDDQWRRRELKMYRMFRERLLAIFGDMYKEWEPLDILALMQHNGIPTRLLDFTFRPHVAAYFALKSTCGDSAIWVVDCERLEQRSKDLGLGDYYGPTHVPHYTKLLDKQFKGGKIVTPQRHFNWLAAQRGCFLNTGSISQPIDTGLIDLKVVLAERLVIESLARLKGLGIDRHTIFPNLGRLAEEVNRFSTTGSAD
jgi:hypothetical protein